MSSPGLRAKLRRRAAVLGALIALQGCTPAEDPTIFPPNVDTSKAVTDEDSGAASNGFDDGTGLVKAKAPGKKR